MGMTADWKKVLIAVFSTAAIVCGSTLPILPVRGESVTESTEEKTETKADETQSYAAYLYTHGAVQASGKLVISAVQNYEGTEGVDVRQDVGGQSGASLYNPEGSTVTWRFLVETAGFYTLKLHYYPMQGKGVNIERAVHINGAIPYSEASNILFSRIWTNKTEQVDRDIYGNDIRPSQTESPIWQEQYCRDSDGYYTQPFTFFLQAGGNTVSLEAISEPMMLETLVFEAPEELPTYAQIMSTYEENGYVPAQNQMITLQGEDADWKSSATLYPSTDRTSPATEPYEESKVKLNTIGGSRWSSSGQFLVWNFKVPKTGLYCMSFKARQNTMSGIISSRRMYIDGEVPFAELNAISFQYNTDWQSQVLGGEEPYLFYLTEGTHQLKLEVTLGDMGPVLREAEELLLELNRIYREILIITGSSPDTYRDYKLDTLIPETIQSIQVQYERLNKIIQSVEGLTEQKNNDNIGVLKTVARQLKSMYERPDNIPKKFSYFKTNIGSLGTWLNSNRKQPLEIDYISVYSSDRELSSVKAGFFDMLQFHVRNFMDSFLIDYNSIGNLTEADNGQSVTVWISSGRDQSQILKSIINDSFVPSTGIITDLKLVAAGTLLSATIAGIGPDVALGVGMGEPVNYALRGALKDLSQFEDFSQVQSWYSPELFVPYILNGGYYALPETQSFPMLFYRTDVLKELNLNVPQTWQDVISMISVLNKRSMEFGLSNTVDVNIFYMLLMQSGGRIYAADHTQTVLDSDASISAFKKWTNFYVNYKVSQEIDLLNRFRVGEIPVGIADYSLYNSLQVSAPEIKGLWSFAPVPGTLRADGTIDRSAVLSSTGCVMLADTKDDEAAWQFMKWWASEETQTRYGTEMESILGESARYPTANREAFARLPWTTAEYKQLEAQLYSAKGIEQVPGSYYLSRHINNAFRKVVLHDRDAKDTLLDYVYIINDEIKNKRKEFHLS